MTCKEQNIRITEDILKENDFFLDDDGWYVWDDSIHNPTQHFVAVCFHRDNSVRNVEIKTARCHLNHQDIQSVNEFADVLRICGLCELADNFKTNMNKNYIDLGLPSGTLWKDSNEGGFYTYDEAVSKFGTNLSTKNQQT